MADKTTIDPSSIAFGLLAELNLDVSETTAIITLVNTAINVIKRSSDAPEDDNLMIPAIKTLATALYYDRSLSAGMPKGLLMMLTHLQATPGGDNNGD